MAILLPPMSMPPMLAKTPHLLCAVHRMPKLFPDVTGGNMPHRGITHTKVLVYSTLEGKHLKDALVHCTEYALIWVDCHAHNYLATEQPDHLALQVIRRVCLSPSLAIVYHSAAVEATHFGRLVRERFPGVRADTH